MEVGYLPGAVRRGFPGVGVSGFQDGLHAHLDRGFDIHVDAVADVEDIFGRLADSFSGDLEDARVRLAKTEFV